MTRSRKADKSGSLQLWLPSELLLLLARLEADSSPCHLIESQPMRCASMEADVCDASASPCLNCTPGPGFRPAHSRALEGGAGNVEIEGLLLLARLEADSSPCNDIESRPERCASMEAASPRIRGP